MGKWHLTVKIFVSIPLDHPVVDAVVAPLPPPVDGDDGADDEDGDEDPGEHSHHDHEDAQGDAVLFTIAIGATCDSEIA